MALSYTGYQHKKSKEEHMELNIFEKDTQEFVLGVGKPVLLVGKHGVGKTTVLRSISSNFGLKMHELNAATLDPFVHIVGIPVTASGKVTMEPPQELQDAEILFIDEVNRADRQTRNALFEIICDHSVNGRKLPNLKLVVAAMNPPDKEYHVDELDTAMEDRFLYKFNIDPDISWALDRLPDQTKREAVQKWYDALEDPPSPRRLTWVIESSFNKEGEINTAAVLNALDDSLYGTTALIKMLGGNITSIKRPMNDKLLTEDEKQVIANVIYSGLRHAYDNNLPEAADIERWVDSTYVNEDGETFLPTPTNIIKPEQRTLFAESTAVKEVNDKFAFQFALSEYKGDTGDKWLQQLLGGE